MKNNARTCRFFDLKVFSNPKSGNHIKTEIEYRTTDLRTILKKFKEHNLSSISKSIRDQGNLTWYVVEIDLDETEEHGIILINRSDRTGADQAIDNTSNNQLRIAQKSETEGNAYSSHFVVNLTPEGDGKRYKCLLEESMGIGRTIIEKMLGQMSRALCKLEPRMFEIPDTSNVVDPKTGLPLMQKIVNQFEMHGHPSDDFVQELITGKVLDIELSSTHSGVVSFDSNSNFRELKKAVKIGIADQEVLTKAKFSLLSEEAKRKNLDVMRVRFKDSTDMEYTINIDTETETLINEQRFVKKTQISGFSSKLATGTIGINQEIVQLMINNL